MRTFDHNLMSATVGEQRAASALRGALQEVQLVHGLLDEYDTTRDKKKLTEVSLKMKHILPTIKVLESPPFLISWPIMGRAVSPDPI